MDNSAFTDIPKFFQKKNENENKKGKLYEINKKREEKKKDEKKNKLLIKLKKIKNKRMEKLESFKTNIENIDLNVK